MNELLENFGLTLTSAIALGAGFIMLVIAIILLVASKNKKQDVDPAELKKVNTENASLQKTISELKEKEEFLNQNLVSKNNQMQELQKKLTDVVNNNDPEIMKQALSDSKIAELGSELDTTKQELASIQKKLKNTESDLEDAEEDLEDTQKKLKKKTEENTEISEKLNSLTKEYEQVKGSLAEKENALTENEKTLSVKLGALDFMSAILMAKDVDDADIRKKYKTIDDIVEYVRDDFSSCLNKNSFSRDESLFGSDLDVWAQVAKKTWLKDKISVAFVGEFSAGKTSIVNSIIKANDVNSQLLPTSSKATTAIPTYISKSLSGKENYLFFTTDNRLKVLDPKVFDVTKEMLDSVDGEETLFKYFIVSYNNPNLENLSILDTPGFSSEDKQDAERTIEVINECDALFWVFDVNNGEVNESSLKTIKDHLKKPLYVVINKIDTVAPSEVDKVEVKISETFKNKGIKVEKIIRYSNDPATVPTETIVNALKSVKRTNNSQDYIENLMNFAYSCVQEQEEASEQARDEWLECDNKVDEAKDALASKISDVKDKCGEARDMPKYASHLFHSDKFEMSVEKGNRFLALMDEIADDEMKELSDLVGNIAETVQEYQNANQKDDEERQKKEELENCVAGLQKRVKAFISGQPDSKNAGSRAVQNVSGKSSDWQDLM
ncbi:MAG: dynamin family protein [Treponema sp.]|nr:dynamin family protein [Treponema sp.]